MHFGKSEYGVLNVKSLGLVFISGFTSGALGGVPLCKEVDTDSKLSQHITKHLGMSIQTLRVGALVVWLALAALFAYLWDADRGKFALPNSRSVLEIIEGRQECVGSGLLAQSQIKASGLYQQSVLIGSIKPIDKQDFSLYLHATQKTLLLELFDNNPTYIGIGSQLEKIGWVACKR